MAKYQAAVSKQSSSTNYTNELKASGGEIKIHKMEQKENVPPGPEVCITHQEGEKISATENSLAVRSTPLKMTPVTPRLRVRLNSLSIPSH